MKTKICSICSIPHPETFYNTRYTFCKACQKQRAKKWNAINAEEQKIKKAEYFQQNKVHLIEKHKTWILNNTEKTRATRKRKYYENHMESKRKSNDLQKRLRRERPLNCMIHRIRARLNSALKVKSWKKTTKFIEYTGCSQQELLKHLETQFTEGMSWENRGLWHIDHKIPLSSAKTEEELYKLCHYTNLQPLWKLDNLTKSNKIE